MNALLLTLLISGGLFGAGVMFFLSTWRRRDLDAIDHLALLPFSEPPSEPLSEKDHVHPSNR
jgi:hypothetical protein